MKKLDAWVRALCPKGRVHEASLEEETWPKLKYFAFEKTRALLLFVLSEAESVAHVSPDNPERKRVLEVVTAAREKLLNHPPHLGVASSPVSDFVILNLDESPTELILILPESFADDFFARPHALIGRSLRQWRGYLDQSGLGPDHDDVRYSRRAATKAFEVEAAFLTLLPEKVLSEAALTFRNAYRSGTDSRAWSEALDVGAGQDLSLLDKMEKYRYEKFEVGQPAEVYNELLLPLAKELLISATREWETGKPNPAALRRLNTFLIGSRMFERVNFFDQANRVPAEVDDWEILRKTLVLLHRKLQTFDKAPAVSEPESPIAELRLREWWDKSAEANKFKKLFRKRYCDEEGEQRRYLLSQLEGKAAAPAPRLPGLDSERAPEPLRKPHAPVDPILLRDKSTEKLSDAILAFEKAFFQHDRQGMGRAADDVVELVTANPSILGLVQLRILRMARPLREEMIEKLGRRRAKW